MIVKVHPTPQGKILAICDSGLKGSVFEDGDLCLDLSSRFYDGEDKGVEEVEVLLKDCYVINAVGKDSVGILVKKGFVEKDNVLSIKGIPYAQCVIDM